MKGLSQVERGELSEKWQSSHLHIGEIKEVRTVYPNSVYVQITTILFPYLLYMSGFHKTLSRPCNRPEKHILQSKLTIHGSTGRHESIDREALFRRY